VANKVSELAKAGWVEVTLNSKNQRTGIKPLLEIVNPSSLGEGGVHPLVNPLKNTGKEDNPSESASAANREAGSLPTTSAGLPLPSVPSLTNEGETGIVEATPPTVFKLYMDVVTKYRLPKPRNFNEVKAKARDLERESEGDSASMYLKALLQIDYNEIDPEDEYKPQLLNAVDIYTKRKAILRYLQAHVEPEQPRALGEAQEVDWSDLP
jgi:hypothetical protein